MSDPAHKRSAKRDELVAKGGRAMTARKTAVKTAVPLVPQRHGGALATGGIPGNAGGTGRPSDEFKALMRSLADRASRALAIAKILDDPTDPLFLPAAKWAAEQGYGRPSQQVEHTGKDGGPITLHVVYDDGDEL